MPAERPVMDTVLEPDLKVASAPAVEAAQDKFFTAFTPAAEQKDSTRPKGGKSSSRFMAFLAPQEDSRVRTEPPTPAAAQGGNPTSESPAQNEEKEAFALLIQKLQRSGVGPTTQAGGAPALAKLFEQPLPPDSQKSAVASPEPFHQYGNDRLEDPRLRGPQLPAHNIISPRPMGLPSQPPAVGPERTLQDLLTQRHIPNQANNRPAQNVAPANSNTEFLMKLMQSRREMPESPRTEMPMRMPQPTKQVSLANIPDHDHDYQRERSASQRQQQQQQQPHLPHQQLQQLPPQQLPQQHMRGQPGLPGYLDEQFHSPDVENRPQPTQILQRQPPPGLDHGIHPFQMGGGALGGGQLPPPPQRPMIPPPGLVNGPPRNMNVNVPLPGMYPSFQQPGFQAPPPEGIMSVPPRNMQPPPGFYNAPPPGFMGGPLPGMPAGFQGIPDGPVFPGNSPFDRRGMLPPGAYRGP